MFYKFLPEDQQSLHDFLQNFRQYSVLVHPPHSAYKEQYSSWSEHAAAEIKMREK